MKPKAVICGSYHRDLAGLKRIFRELEATGCRILSPLSVNFIDTKQPVVKLASEDEFTINELEKFHLRAIDEADFVWLHAPEGHVGLSASFEMGYARARKKPVFCFIKPSDEMLACQAVSVPSVFEAMEAVII